MKESIKNSEEAVSLRKKAEQLLKNKAVLKTARPAAGDDPKRSEADTIKLLHELEVHKIELEMQNEELQLAKEKAETNAEKYTNLYDFAPSGYVTLDHEFRIQELNFNGAKMLGKERSKLINRNFSLFVALDKRKLFRGFLDKVLETKTKQTCEVAFTIPKNPAIYAHIECVFAETEQKYMLTIVDISERNEAEQRLKASDERWKMLFQNVPNVAVQGYDKNEKTIYWNKASETFYGYSSEEALGSKLTDLIIPDEAKREVSAAIKEMFATKKPIAAKELILKRKDGSSIMVFSSHAYVQILDGEPEMYCLDIDLSKRKQAESELIQAKEKAEESNRLKSAFLANMSHEIRTPMNGILGFSDLLKEPNLTGEEQQNYIRIIEKGGARMLNIINDIMSISKIESGSMKVNLKESNINDQIEYVYTFFRPAVQTKGVQFSFKNALPLSESFVDTDKEKLFAILTNLVKNAIKYTESGSIELGYTKKGQYLEFYVKDTGVGIDNNRQEAIFERFIQADITDKNALQGAGLGLSISKAYVEMLGGKLWVESEKGKGSIFYFTIPYNIELRIANAIINDSENEGPEIKNLKILIVEDDEISYFLTRLIIKGISREILHAKDGSVAIELCRNNLDIDLILMDIKMPIIDGYEATRQIRQFNTDVIIIAQTAFAFSGDKEKAKAAGCNKHLSKPINKNKLLSIIAQYFSK